MKCPDGVADRHDITTPELMALWQEGRKEPFYPYGKTYLQTLGEQGLRADAVSTCELKAEVARLTIAVLRCRI